jgi:hypothetical protein
MSSDAELWWTSPEAKEARRLTYQVEVAVDTLRGYSDPLYPDDTYAVHIDGKGTILIDNERVQFVVSHGQLRASTGYDGQTRVAVKDWRKRKDAMAIGRAINEAIWAKWNE